MIKTLSQMSEDSKNHNIGITVPVSGEIITEKRAVLLKSLLNDRFEIAIHGFHHEDFSIQPLETLIEDISKAKSVFEKCGLSPTGYRAPYLRSRADLLLLLAKNGFSYSSSGTTIMNWVKAKNRDLLMKANKIASGIYESKQINKEDYKDTEIPTEIPVSLPDDEILIDRMGIRDVGLLGSILEDEIRASLESVSFAVIQIHPERYPLMREALFSAVENLRSEGGIRFVTLQTLSDSLRSRPISADTSGVEKLVCVTGDLDIMSLSDLWN
jgi:peptidoglycan/xylan/chitin deacetylase (PgdA/CDA1 family)